LKVDRRTLLVGGGAGLGLALAWAVWPRSQGAVLRPAKGTMLLGAGIAIDLEGRVTIAIPQVETGQGSWTGLAQLAADELGAAWERVAVTPGLPSVLWANRLAGEQGWLDAAGLSDAIGGDERWLRITAGSTSIRALGEVMRDLGASARALLLAEAGKRWDVDPAECDTSGGNALHEGKILPFGTLAEGAAQRALGKAPRRTSVGALAGRSLPRLDALPKANGTLRFAADVRLPGSLFASLRLARAQGRAVVESAAPAGISFEKGETWIAAIAADWWAAEAALAKARIRTFGPAGGDDSAIEAALDAALAAGDADVLHERGDVEEGFGGLRPLTAEYSAAAALHLDLEPPAATARLADGLLEVWASTQAPEALRHAVAAATGTDLTRTMLYPMPVGGQGGRALENDVAVIAAQLAQRTGKPVQVQLSHAEQVRSDPVRSPLKARLMARSLPDGRIAAWRMRLAGDDGTAAAMRRLLGGESAGFRSTAVPLLPYAIPALRIEAVSAGLPIRTGYHRGDLLGPMTFFSESFIDELARIGGRDPLSVRMALLGGNPRLARCLIRATALGGWDGGGAGSQMGVAVASVLGSHIALVASAGVGSDGRVAVSRLVAAIECGRVVNQALVRQQIEGGLIAALAIATAPAPQFRHGQVLAPRTLPAPGLRAQPEILVEMLPSRAAPGGVNGLASAVAAAAVGNAIAAGTGRRLRSLPFDPMSR